MDCSRLALATSLTRVVTMDTIPNSVALGSGSWRSRRCRSRSLGLRSLGMSRRRRPCTSTCLNYQSIAFIARQLADLSRFLRQFNRSVSLLQRIRVLFLLIERERQAQNNDRIRIAGIRVDRLTKIDLSIRV